MSARYAGTVAKQPPYIDRMTHMKTTNSASDAPSAVLGMAAYMAKPSRKKVAEVALRPILSDREAQKKRPAILKSESRPVKPAAMAAIEVFCAGLSSLKARSMPINLPANTSCSIGEAMPMMPMPAVTLTQSTVQTNQNWRVFQAWLRCT